jgi:multimeric flavodoxin WrbA
VRLSGIPGFFTEVITYIVPPDSVRSMGSKVIALLGSPLPSGNTARLLDQAILGAKDAGCEVEKIMVPDLDFEPCREILFCVDHEICQMEDDITPLYAKFAELDGLIVATPVMTMGVPGKLKSLMDRFQVFFMAKYNRKKPLVPAEHRARRKGLYIGISGMNFPEVFDGSKMTIRAFFDITDIQYSGELLIRDMDSIRDIGSRPDLLQEARRKGRELCQGIETA